MTEIVLNHIDRNALHVAAATLQRQQRAFERDAIGVIAPTHNDFSRQKDHYENFLLGNNGIFFPSFFELHA